MTFTKAPTFTGMPLRRLVAGLVVGELPLAVACVVPGKSAAAWVAL